MGRAKTADRPRSTAALGRLLGYLRPHAAGLALALALSLVVVISQLAVPVLSGQAVDCAVGPGEVDLFKLGRILTRLALAIGATVVSEWALAALTNRIAISVVRGLRVEAFSKLQVLPLSHIDGHRHGDIVSRVVTDIEQLSTGVVMAFQQLATGVLTIGLTLGFMFSLNPAVTAVVVLVTPLSAFAAKFIASRGFTSFHELSERRGELAGLVEEYVGARDVIEAADAQARAQARFDAADAGLSNASFWAVFYSSLVNPTTRFVNAIVYAGVGITGALSVIDGGLTVGGLTAFLAYANQYTKPFNDISEVAAELQNSLACASRVFELLDEDEQAPDEPGAHELCHVRGEVAFENVSFSYSPDRPLIRNFTLFVAPGTRVAIVGPTGCGKTTLINLLMRFFEVDGGAILVDGHDIRHVTRKSLRAAFGMVLQDTWLKSASVRENLTLGRPDATPEEVEAAGRAAFADDFVRRLPQGYDTRLGGEDAQLSAGQRQLLCIARAMLADAPMLILDEATSNIDTRTETKVQAALARLMEGRTSFVVAHRLSTIREADLIVAMRDGQIVETGTHDELLAAGGFYASLYNSQFSQ